MSKYGEKFDKALEQVLKMHLRTRKVFIVILSILVSIPLFFSLIAFIFVISNPEGYGSTEMIGYIFLCVACVPAGFLLLTIFLHYAATKYI